MDSRASSPVSSQDSLVISEAPTPELDISDLPDLVPDVPTNVSLPLHRRRPRIRDMSVAINVVGTSNIRATADLVRLQINLNKIAEDEEASEKAALETVGKIESLVRKLSSSSSEIKSSLSSGSSSRGISSAVGKDNTGLSLQIVEISKYPYIPGKIPLPSSSGSLPPDSAKCEIQSQFQTAITLSITYVSNADFSVLAHLCTDLKSIQSVSVTEVHWGLTDSSKAKHEVHARAEAVHNAKSQAQDYARALGCGGALRPVEMAGPGIQLNGTSDDHRKGPKRQLKPTTSQSMTLAVKSKFSPLEVEVECKVQVKYEALFD